MSLHSKLVALNSSLQSSLSFGNQITFYELCDQTERDGKTFPIENQGNGQGKLVHWKDTYRLQIYHRLLDTAKDNDFALGFGNKAQGTTTYTLRLVGIGTRKLLTAAGYEDNVEFAESVADAIPNILFSGTATYLQVNDIEATKQLVYNEEYEGIDMKHLKLEGIAFYIDYELREKSCCQNNNR